MPRILIDPRRIRNGAQGGAFRKELVAALMSLEELDEWFRTRSADAARSAAPAKKTDEGDKEDPADDDVKDEEDDDDEFEDDEDDAEDGDETDTDDKEEA